jgi:hypothetical protein
MRRWRSCRTGTFELKRGGVSGTSISINQRRVEPRDRMVVNDLVRSVLRSARAAGCTARAEIGRSGTRRRWVHRCTSTWRNTGSSRRTAVSLQDGHAVRPRRCLAKEDTRLAGSHDEIVIYRNFAISQRRKMAAVGVTAKYVAHCTQPRARGSQHDVRLGNHQTRS